MLTEKQVLERAFQVLDGLVERKEAREVPAVGSTPAESARGENLSTHLESDSAPPANVPNSKSGEPTKSEGLGLDGDSGGVPWAEWKAAVLNRVFQEQGVTGEPGRIVAATVRHGLAAERGR